MIYIPILRKSSENAHISVLSVAFFVRKEMVEELFSSVAEVADVYFPVDLKHGCKSRGFAFIRFARQSDCDKAVRDLNGVYLGIGRNIVVSQPNCRTYFSQDESNS